MKDDESPMMESSPPTSGDEPTPPSARVVRRGVRAQLRLGTVAWLLAVVAVWTTTWINRQRIADLNVRIASSRPLARDLVIEDPTRIAVVKLEENWYDEQRWDVYLPEGLYTLNVATRAITDGEKIPAPARSVALPSGRFVLELMQTPRGNEWDVRVTRDGKSLLNLPETTDWDESAGSSGGSSITANTRLPRTEPAVLFRRRFNTKIALNQSRTPDGPANGLMLWIAPAEPGRAAFR